MYNILLIVFRETLEAALFVGIVAAATQGLVNRKQILIYGIGAGLLGSLLLASVSNSLANALNGLGQDLAQACILGTAWIMLGWHCISSQQHGREAAMQAKKLSQNVVSGNTKHYWLAAAVALTVLREGAETVLFVLGAQASASSTAAGMWVVIAVVIAGIALGCTCSAAVFMGLKVFSVKVMFKITHILLVLFTAAIASRLAKLALSSGWVNVLSDTVWYTDDILPIKSVLGSLLNALLGYDAQPAEFQLFAYVGTIVLVLLLTHWYNRSKTISVPPQQEVVDKKVVEKLTNTTEVTDFAALFVLSVLFTGSMFISMPSKAGPSDYVYTPIIEEGEREIDYKTGSWVDRMGNRKTVTSLGLGYSPKSWWFTEFYAKAVNEDGKTSFDAWEWENKFQLTERGKYPIDLGLLIEVERPKDRSEGYEIKTGLLTQYEKNKYQFNFNTLLQRSIKTPNFQETELQYQYQAKYRYLPQFEMGLQGYSSLGKWNKWSGGNNAQHSVGPAVFGSFKLDPKQKIVYNAAWLRGTTSTTPKNTFRIQTEYEF